MQFYRHWSIMYGVLFYEYDTCFAHNWRRISFYFINYNKGLISNKKDVLNYIDTFYY